MPDPTGMPTMPGAEALTNGLSAATKSFQGFASEVQKMSKDSLDQTTQAMDKLRGAKTMEEILAIQTSYMQASFASYTDNARRLSELMMTVPMDLMKQGRAAMHEGTEAVKTAVDQATDQHHG